MKAVDLVLDMIGFRWYNLFQCSLNLFCNKLENKQIKMIQPVLWCKLHVTALHTVI